MWRKNGMPVILYPLPKIVKKFNTIVFTGGTGESGHPVRAIGVTFRRFSPLKRYTPKWFTFYGRNPQSTQKTH